MRNKKKGEREGNYISNLLAFDMRCSPSDCSEKIGGDPCSCKEKKITGNWKNDIQEILDDIKSGRIYND